MEKRYCKKCGRPLDIGDIEYCRGCVDENIQFSPDDIEEYYTSNNTASIIKNLAKFIATIGIIASIIVGLNLENLLISFIGSIASVLSVLLLYALGELIEIMHDIRTNSEHIRDYLESEKK